jgi:hypothetical protein
MPYLYDYKLSKKKKENANTFNFRGDNEDALSFINIYFYEDQTATF